MTYLSLWKRSLGPAVLALAALLLPDPARSAEAPEPTIKPPVAVPTYEGREENETITIDLETVSFGKDLPFDVAFKIEGPLPERFGRDDRLDARWVEFNRVPDCQGFFSQFRAVRAGLPDLEETDDIPVRRPRRPDAAIAQSGFRKVRVFDAVTGRTVESRMVQLGETTTSTTTTTTTATGLKFLADFPPLKPNHYYCFQFISRRRLADDELDALQVDFQKAVDEELRKPKYQQSGSFVVQTRDYERLRDTLAAIIESNLTTPNQVVQAPRGSFFDVRSSLADVNAKYRAEFGVIANTTVGARLDGVSNFKQEMGLAAVSLTRLAKLEIDDGQNLRQILIANESDVGDRLQEVEDETQVNLLSLLGLAETGAQPEIPAVENVWSAAALDEEIQNIRALSRAVASLSGIAATAGVDAPELEAPDLGLTAPDPEALERAIQALPEPARAAARQAAAAAPPPADESLIAQSVQNLDAAANALGQLQKALRTRDEAIAEWVRQILVIEKQELVVGANTIAKYDTRAIWYMSADLGTGISPDTEDFFTYIGWNLYFRPVNKKAHLSWAGRPYGLREEFMRRFSVTLGLTQSGFEEEGPLYQGIVGSSAAVIGAGFRINDSLRLSVGGLVFENENPDPLISSTTLNWAPYAALSFDWNVTATLTGLFTKP